MEKSGKKYYDAYTLVEENEKISGVLDVTPFLVYFIENIYNRLEVDIPPKKTMDQFVKLLEEGKVIEKERDLWNFMLTVYGVAELSIKQLEKNFGDAAYTTIRGLVLKLEELGLLFGTKYGNRVKYQVKI